MKLPASIIVSRAQGGGEDQIHISITDETSGCRILEFRMSLEEYAKATTASFGRGEMDYYADCPIGKIRETKTEVIPFRGSAYNAKQKAKAIALMSKF